MDLSPAALAHVARLARLDLTEEELARLAVDVAGILTHFERLEDVQGEPLPPVLGNLRADEPAAATSVDQILANVPRVEGGRIRVERAR